MKKLLLDTNIIIDLLAKREPFYKDAARLFSLGDRKQIQLGVSSLTIANTNYVLLKYNNAAKVKSILGKFKLLVYVLPLDDKIISLALNDEDFKDFEDGLQYFSAIQNGQDIIISRNLKDFKKSKISVMSAGQFLKAFAS